MAISKIKVGSVEHELQTTISNISGLQNKLNEIDDKLSVTNIAYGSCPTAADVSGKVVTTIGHDDWELNIGSLIMVTFDVTNTASNVTLNVNNTGAYPIWYNNAEYVSTGNAYTGYAGRTITYAFNGTHWVWISSSYDANTQSNTNSTDTNSKIFLVGATSQGSNKTTYSHNEVYVGTDHHVYSNGKQTVNLSDTQALTNKTYEGYTLGAACAKGVDTAATSGSANLITSGGAYSALNDLSTKLTNGTTKVGKAGTADSATKATQDSLGRSISETYLTISQSNNTFDQLQEEVTGLGESFSQVIEKMYGSDFSEDIDTFITIRGIATDEAAKVKNELLNGAGAAYDTLKELADLIIADKSAIEALETIAAGKIDKVPSLGMPSAIAVFNPDGTLVRGMNSSDFDDSMTITGIFIRLTYDLLQNKITETSDGDATVLPIEDIISEEIMPALLFMLSSLYKEFLDENGMPPQNDDDTFPSIYEIANAIVEEAIALINQNKVDKTTTVNGKPLSSDITLTSKDINGVEGQSFVLSDGTTKTALAGAEVFNTGANNKATGMYAHAEGMETEATGSSSHAQGANTKAKGAYSHTEGIGTVANKAAQHVQGKYNIIANTNLAHIVGNGSASTPSNAHTLDWDGNAWFAGDIKIGGTGWDDSSAKTLATTDDIMGYDYGTEDLVAGSSELATGRLYFVYE